MIEYLSERALVKSLVHIQAHAKCLSLARVYEKRLVESKFYLGYPSRESSIGKWGKCLLWTRNIRHDS